MSEVRFISIYSILAVNAWLRLARFFWADVKIGRGSWIKGKTIISRGCGIGWNFSVRGSGVLSLGKYCAVGENVRVITSNHETRCLALNFRLQSSVIGKRLMGKKRDVSIGNDVWIGDHAIILPGVTIGDGAIIGAGAVVTKSVPPFTIAAGNPASVIGQRFNQKTINDITRMAWWDWPLDEMRENRHLFEQRIEDEVNQDA